MHYLLLGGGIINSIKNNIKITNGRTRENGIGLSRQILVLLLTSFRSVLMPVIKLLIMCLCCSGHAFIA